MTALSKRVERVEREIGVSQLPPANVVICQEGETNEETVRRLYGDAGLPSGFLTLFIHPVTAEPRGDWDVIEDDNNGEAR